MFWKELLRPTKGKLILFVIIFLIFVPFIDHDTGKRCTVAPCYGVDEPGSFAVYLILSMPYIYNILYPVLIAGLVVSYLTSCVGVRIYHKIKK